MRARSCEYAARFASSDLRRAIAGGEVSAGVIRPSMRVRPSTRRSSITFASSISTSDPLAISSCSCSHGGEPRWERAVDSCTIAATPSCQRGCGTSSIASKSTVDASADRRFVREVCGRAGLPPCRMLVGLVQCGDPSWPYHYVQGSATRDPDRSLGRRGQYFLGMLAYMRSSLSDAAPPLSSADLPCVRVRGADPPRARTRPASAVPTTLPVDCCAARPRDAATRRRQRRGGGRGIA